MFASALDWPGWSRSGRDEAAALAALTAAAPRYVVVAAEAGLPFDMRSSLEVVERLAGGSTTDFGAPEVVAEGDRRPLTAPEAERLAALVDAAWRVFDRVAAAAPAQLRKGPRGGGRDRDAIVAHVVEAEARYYSRKLGLRVFPQDDYRSAILDVLRSGRSGAPLAERGWPARYAARRIAWHALDHAWEIEDRSTA